MAKTPENYRDVFDNYTIPELLKIQRKINKELLRRLQTEEDR